MIGDGAGCGSESLVNLLAWRAPLILLTGGEVETRYRISEIRYPKLLRGRVRRSSDR